MQPIPIILLLVVLIGLPAVSGAIDPVANAGSGVQDIVDFVDSLSPPDGAGYRCDAPC